MSITKIFSPHLYPNTRIIFNRSKDNFGYRSKLRSLIVKYNGLTGKIENHHIIPKQFRKHLVLEKIKFDIHGSHNICILPNQHFDTDWSDTGHMIIHNGGHKAYNRFVKDELDNMIDLKGDELKLKFWLLIMYLKHALETNDKAMPWKD
tara:strand:+ start:9876 stop:10322 length:447 start_codon:yes stop_codon:yes gene_type:complete